MRKRLVKPIYPGKECHLGRKLSYLEGTWDTKSVQSGYPPLQEALFRDQSQPRSNGDITGGFSHKRRRVFPDPNFPQMSDNSCCGNVMERSINTNLVLGVEAAEEVVLAERARSCGQVTVAFCKAIVLSCSSAGGTDETSAPMRYFSIRRRETTLCGPRVRHR